MTRAIREQLLDIVSLDREVATPLFRQLDTQLRQAIVSQRLPAGTRLPATRKLAQELGVSRITVQNTYEQLIAEGYLMSVGRSGTYVAEIGAHDLSPKSLKTGLKQSQDIGRLSQRGARIAKTEAATRLGKVRSFRPGTPALDLLPINTWARLWSKHLRRAPGNESGYGEPGGHPELRYAIADYLRDARAVNCDAEQVIITTGAQQAFIMIALSLLDPGDRVWFEDPGHIAGRDIFAAAGVEVIPAAIDHEGLNPRTVKDIEPLPKLIFVTPSHQHPLGVTMSIRRRLELLEYARQRNAWILEDDYDSEFRYTGRPISAMQGLDTHDSVLYVGTFSKVLFPSIRLGYLVVPPALIKPLHAAQVLISQSMSTLTQVVLAEFINTGYFTSHLRKMRISYAERLHALTDQLQTLAGDILDVSPPDAGMHLIAWLPDGVDDREISEAIWKSGIEVLPLSIYCFQRSMRGGLILGFTNTPVEEMAAKVAILTKVLRTMLRP